MLTVPADVAAALNDVEVVSEVSAVAQYGGRSVDLRLHTDGGLTWDANGELQCTGDLRAFGFGESLVPKARDAFLAPFGQEVTVSRVVKMRDGDYPIPLGVFRITGNDGGRERLRVRQVETKVPAVFGLIEDPDRPGTFILTTGESIPEPSPGVFSFPDEWVTADPDGVWTIVGPVVTPAWSYFTQELTSVVEDWEVGVSLADRLRMLQRAKIVNPASPPAGATVYSELQRLTLFPLERNPAVADQLVPSGTVYDDRRSAVSLLAGFAGAKVRVTRQGALTLRPADRWAYETALDFDIDGVVELSDEQSDEFYNFVWAHNPDGSVSAFASFLDDTDPRSVGRAGPSTYEHSSPVYTTQAQAEAGAWTVLSRLLNRRSRVATVKVGAEGLLLDLSDYGRFTDTATGRTVTGEVSGLRVQNDPTALVEVTVIVAENS